MQVSSVGLPLYPILTHNVKLVNSTSSLLFLLFFSKVPLPLPLISLTLVGFFKEQVRLRNNVQLIIDFFLIH